MHANNRSLEIEVLSLVDKTEPNRKISNTMADREKVMGIVSAAMTSADVNNARHHLVFHKLVFSTRPFKYHNTGKARRRKPAKALGWEKVE